MWGLSDLAVDGSVQYFSRKQRCVATLQPVGDPGVPFLESIQLPQGSKEVNIQVSLQLLFLVVASQPVPSCLYLNGLGQVPRSYVHVLPRAEARGHQGGL